MIGTGTRSNRRGRRELLAALAGIAALVASGAAAAFVHPTALAYDSRQAPRTLDPTAELHCLALNVYHEARSESEQGKFAVARVTLNRVASPRYPDTVCEVVWQRRQFSWTLDGRSDRPYDRRAWDDALWVATVAYLFDPQSMVGDATHYHAAYVTPHWAEAYRQVARVGTHIFYAPRES